MKARHLIAWEVQKPKIPSYIGPIFISLATPDGTNIYRYNVAILDQNHEIFCHVIGNLADIVSNGRINQAAGILGDVLAKAESELI